MTVQYHDMSTSIKPEEEPSFFDRLLRRKAKNIIDGEFVDKFCYVKTRDNVWVGAALIPDIIIDDKMKNPADIKDAESLTNARLRRISMQCSIKASIIKDEHLPSIATDVDLLDNPAPMRTASSSILGFVCWFGGTEPALTDDDMIKTRTMMRMLTGSDFVNTASLNKLEMELLEFDDKTHGHIGKDVMSLIDKTIDASNDDYDSVAGKIVPYLGTLVNGLNASSKLESTKPDDVKQLLNNFISKLHLVGIDGSLYYEASFKAALATGEGRE